MSSRGRGRGRGRGHSRGHGHRGEHSRHSSGQGWDTSEKNVFSIPPPSGLRGREIGLYYKNLSKKKNENKDESQQGTMKRKRELNIIRLSLPSFVLSALKNNLSAIKNIAKKCNINLHALNFEAIIQKNDNQEATTSKVIKTEEKDMIVEDSNTIPKLAGSSRLNETIDKDITPFKGAGDYKYSYEDIITGTFEEKLNENIANGITISKINDEVNNLNLKLYSKHQEVIVSKEYRKMMEFREKLPAYKKQAEILEVVNNNQVVVISGETGCGKSTQVPQMILDEAICNKRGGLVKVLVTQPRRIAAMSLAVRVADERAEEIGNSVGYTIRLERVNCRPRGSITFCTTGVLLSELEVSQGLTDYSHIILDEVHERDCHIDISMCMLKQVLKKRPDLKVILMSATLDAEKLSKYFDDCPMLHIEGLAYPVQDIYLEDILKVVKYQIPEEVDKRRKKGNFHWKAKKQNMEKMEKEIQYRAEISGWIESKKKDLDKHVYQTLLDHRIEILSADLILEVLIYICKGDPGAILVFVPGIGDITALLRKMDESGQFPESRFEVHPLHSKLPTLEQRRIFERPPEHIRKIIIATNIAETSITIDDIVYVVDSGRIKMNGLNVEENLSTLSVQWVSQANLRQRRGRAGRCQPGICYHLLTSFRGSKLEDRLLPEIQRSDLLEPVLQLKKLRLGKAETAMGLLPEPPAVSTVQWAVEHLTHSGALSADESLTPLGWHLARLPVHPAAGKLLLFGALFGSLDRAASVAAIWGFKDPFQLVIGKEKQVDQKKRLLAMGEPSDHVAMSQAVLEWESRSSYSSRRDFAYEHFLSNNTLELLTQMKRQLGDGLKQMGFLRKGSVNSAWENRNAENMSLFKAIVAAALYPNIAAVRWPRSRNPYKPLSVYTPDHGRVKLHPGSVMAQGGKSACSGSKANWLVYWLKQKTTDLFLIDVTLVYSLPLLFFGEMKITEAESNDEIYWTATKTKVICKKETAKLLFELRCLLDQVLASKVMSAGEAHSRNSEFENKVLNAVIDIITAQDEMAEYLINFDDSDQSEHESSH